MSAEKRRSTAHVKPRRSSNHNGVGLRDVSQTVETYHNLLDRLYPVFAVWDIALYVARYCALCSVVSTRGYWRYRRWMHATPFCAGGRTTY